MPDPNITLDQLFTADRQQPEYRQLLHNLVEAVQLDSGSNFPDALDHVYEAANWARDSGEPTLAGLLKSLGTSAAAGVTDSLKLLEQRDSVVTKDLSRSAEKLKRDGFGRVTLDQSYKDKPGALDAHGRVTDPARAGDRLRRAQRIWPNQYDGPDGIQQFELEDAQYLSAGVDMLKTAELDREAAQTQARVGQTARELDQAIVADSERRRELRELDGQIDELSEKRLELDGAPASSGESDLKLLDLPVFASWSDGQKKALKKAQKRLRRLEMPETAKNLVWALDQAITGEPMPKKPTPDRPRARPATSAPPGVHPSSHAMHERITERMKLLDCGYQQACESIIAEGDR